MKGTVKPKSQKGSRNSTRDDKTKNTKKNSSERHLSAPTNRPAEDRSTSQLTKELRQREIKCQKWEEELRTRELALSDKLKELSSLQSMTLKLEAKIKELERSNQILRLENLTHVDPITPAPKYHPTPNTSKQQSEHSHDRIQLLERKLEHLQQRDQDRLVSSLENRILFLELASRGNQPQHYHTTPQIYPPPHYQAPPAFMPMRGPRMPEYPHFLHQHPYNNSPLIHPNQEQHLGLNQQFPYHQSGIQRRPDQHPAPHNCHPYENFYAQHQSGHLLREERNTHQTHTPRHWPESSRPSPSHPPSKNATAQHSQHSNQHKANIILSQERSTTTTTGYGERCQLDTQTNPKQTIHHTTEKGPLIKEISSRRIDNTSTDKDIARHTIDGPQQGQRVLEQKSKRKPPTNYPPM